MLVKNHAILHLFGMAVVGACVTQSAMGFVTHTNNHHGILDTTRSSVQGLVIEQHSSTRGGLLLGVDITRTATATRLFSLKPAAVPLMDSGKALARSGELLIEITSGMNLYGGALSTVGALIRNSGDNVAQAAASCRFKTGTELVIDELRQGAESLMEAKSKLQLAAEEAQADKQPELAKLIEATVENMLVCGQALESAGAGLLQRKSLAEVGSSLVECAERLQILSTQVTVFAPNLQESKDCGQRMAFAADRMMEAGNQLKGTPQPKTTGKGWMKG